MKDNINIAIETLIQVGNLYEDGVHKIPSDLFNQLIIAKNTLEEYYNKSICYLKIFKIK